MKLLYGVQATGQGHISRARAVANALAAQDVDVTWLFSGRDRNRLFDMEPFGDFEHRTGLTFVTEAGRMRYRKTAWGAKLREFGRDVSGLDLDCFDLIVTDYEPITAWAGRRQQRNVIGIGHQYAFGPGTPVAGNNLLQRQIMRRFAPVTRPVGLHWAAFDENVLPPILDLPELDGEPTADHILVYLPFEDQSAVTRWLQGFPDTAFHQYANGLANDEAGNVSRRAASIQGFKQALASCRGVICNCGFELISECLQWQKPVLTRPLTGQMEQLSNAAALTSLGYAQVMDNLDDAIARRWLDTLPVPPTIRFPDVAMRLARWLAGGAEDPVSHLSAELWR